MKKLANSLRTAFALALLLIAGAEVIAASQKVRIEPKFFAGESLRYRVALRTSGKSSVVTPIVNPEGGSEFKQSATMIIRLDVVSMPPVASKASTTSNAPSAAVVPAGMRLRITFEQSDANDDSDAVNPGAPSMQDSFRKLAGHSIEFTVGADGQPTDFAGLEEINSTPQNASGLFTWLGTIIATDSLPKRGIAIGEKWSNERTLTGMPLTGLVWRAESSYLRDEACGPSPDLAQAAGAVATKREPCAVILTRFGIAHEGSPHADSTPDDYIKSGLRTMGKWNGSGESLESISIASGVLVSSTQSSQQDTDYTITSAATGSKIHQQGHMTTETEITLLPSEGPKT